VAAVASFSRGKRYVHHVPDGSDRSDGTPSAASVAQPDNPVGSNGQPAPVLSGTGEGLLTTTGTGPVAPAVETVVGKGSGLGQRSGVGPGTAPIASPRADLPPSLPLPDTGPAAAGGGTG